jgi:uncharacterized repeat protein (TIGR03803 family)
MQRPLLLRFSLRIGWSILFLLATLVSGVGASAAVTEKILHNFSNWPHGFEPNGGLTADAAGNLYGTTYQGGDHYYGAIYELSPNSQGGWKETLLYSFSGGADGNGPTGTVLFDGAGNLYGATVGGGGTDSGTIFKLTRQANGRWTERVIWNFHGEDGFTPTGGLVFDLAGNLYGVTYSGGGVGLRICGQGGCGTVFRLTPQKSGLWSQTTLYRFQGLDDGANPTANLILDSKGNLFGSARYGGASNYNYGGVVYEISPVAHGWRESVLYTFTGNDDGGNPGPIISDGAGNFYGTTAAGGSNRECESCGTIFELSPNAGGNWTENVIHSFNGRDGEDPQGALFLDQSGNLTGNTYTGGSNFWGTVFRLTPEANGKWSETVLWNFTGGVDGAKPYFGVTVGSGGQVIGTATLGGGVNGNGTIFELTPGSGGFWKETTLNNFPDGSGSNPQSAPILDSAGNLYGTNSSGGANGAGSLYQLVSAGNGRWQENIIYNFPAGAEFTLNPSHLVFDSAGNIYGETEYGGARGFGTIFELSPDGGSWVEKDVYTFAGGADGAYPQGGLIFDKAGSLYGTTQTGGTSPSCGRAGCGTVFKLSASDGGWNKTTLYQFLGGTTDAEDPVDALVFDSNGNLYGTALGGGVDGGNNCGIGCGSVFELSPTSGGWRESVLYFFTEKRGDGAIPSGSLVLDKAGNLYGTTSTGGQQSFECGIGCGTVFELSPSGAGSWTETVLYQFTGPSGPLAGLAFDSAGNLYGTNRDSVFELSPSLSGGWNEAALYTFGSSGGEDGSDAEFSSVIVDPAGNLYGTTIGGGSAGGGTVFEITQ